MRNQDPWSFIVFLIVVALIWAALAAVANTVFAIVTAPWFLPVMAAMAVVGIIALVAYLRSRS